MSLYPRAEISLDAIQHNLACVRRLAPYSKIMSVIKADAYGHGIKAIAAALADSDAFAVARLKEGIALRALGFQLPIVLLEGVHSLTDMETAARYQLTPVIHQTKHIDWLQDCEDLPFCWLMLETGMHRLGLPVASIRDAIQQLPAYDDRLGLMSHFANSDLVGDLRNQNQLMVIKKLAAETGLPVCMANSAAVLSLPESHADWVRPGLMLYGISPFADKAGPELGLQPVMQLKSTLIATQWLKAGDEVGYGGEWTAKQSCRMGVISIGYGDGVSRHLSNTGQVLIRGKQLPVIGRVSMDTICVLLEDCPDAQTGDEVLLWGNVQLTVESQALRADTIPYELTTVLASRVDREYLHGKS
ncbi:MAG: alanine racemase [Methylophaga sp.]|nr:alanine racemase [Methylophaga sp.]